MKKVLVHNGFVELVLLLLEGLMAVRGYPSINKSAGSQFLLVLLPLFQLVELPQLVFKFLTLGEMNLLKLFLSFLSGEVHS